MLSHPCAATADWTLASIQTVKYSSQSHNAFSDGIFIDSRKAELDRFVLAGLAAIAAQWHHIDLPSLGRMADVLSEDPLLEPPDGLKTCLNWRQREDAG